MKNSAKAFAPAAVCMVAATGITGGRSPGFVFGPVRGTSAGTVGVPGEVGDVGAEEDVVGVELLGSVEVDIDVGGIEAVDGTVDECGCPEEVQPATDTAATTTISHNRRTP